MAESNKNVPRVRDTDFYEENKNDQQIIKPKKSFFRNSKKRCIECTFFAYIFICYTCGVLNGTESNRSISLQSG